MISQRGQLIRLLTGVPAGREFWSSFRIVSIDSELTPKLPQGANGRNDRPRVSSPTVKEGSGRMLEYSGPPSQSGYCPDGARTSSAVGRVVFEVILPGGYSVNGG
jgi:hypothetical protein